ncbi:MAG: hypothetical protein KDD41_11980 [Flavobacteriales bacterium]|nr:hypothetical protein [Flavobacteriales bacterium]
MSKDKKEKGFGYVLWNVVEQSRSLFFILLILFGIAIWVKKCSSEDRNIEEKELYEQFKKDTEGV